MIRLLISTFKFPVSNDNNMNDLLVPLGKLFMDSLACSQEEPFREPLTLGLLDDCFTNWATALEEGSSPTSLMFSVEVYSSRSQV